MKTMQNTFWYKNPKDFYEKPGKISSIIYKIHVKTGIDFIKTM